MNLYVREKWPYWKWRWETQGGDNTCTCLVDEHGYIMMVVFDDKVRLMNRREDIHAADPMLFEKIDESIVEEKERVRNKINFEK